MSFFDHTKPELTRAIKLSLPAVTAYFPLGIVFALIGHHMGLPWYLTTTFSFLVYAGSAQFVAISLMAHNAAYLTMMSATLFLALRNTFYGLSYLDRFGDKWWIKGLLAFGLVDANYALYAAEKPEESKNPLAFIIYSSIIIYLAWCLGTLFGAVFASYVPKIPGLTFILPAFFLVLVIEKVMKSKKFIGLVFPAIAFPIAYIINPANFLLIAILLTVGMLFVGIKMGVVK